MFNKKNGVAMTLTFIGFIEIIAGFILGLVFGLEDVGYYTTRYEPIWSIIIPWWAIGFVSGMFIIGIAEIIEQLHKLNHKGKNSIDEQELSDETNATNEQAKESENNWSINEDDFERLFDYYSARNYDIKDIMVPPFENIYIVVKQDGLNKYKSFTDVVTIEGENINSELIEEHPEIKKWYLENKDDNDENETNHFLIKK